MATTYKRGKQYWGRVQRKGEDLRKPLKTTVKSVAEKRFRKWLDEIDRVAWGDKPRRTFDDAMLKFIDEHLPTLKPKAAKRYLVSIDHLTDAFEGRSLERITSAALSEFETARRRAGAKIPEKMIGKKRPKPISPATIRRDLACLSSMFGCCIEWEWVEFNPVPAYLKSRKKRGLKESPPKRTYATRGEEAKLLAASLPKRHGEAKPGDRDLYDAISLAIDTGLRSNELFGLTRAQLAYARREIEVRGANAKNSKDRNVPMLPRALATLTVRPVVIRRPAPGVSAQDPAQRTSPYVLTNPETGTRYGQLNKGLAAACARAGIRRLTWHDLRRTCGCRLLQDYGMSMEQVSRWLGHSSVKVTEQAYAFLEDEHLHRAIAAGTFPGTGKADRTGEAQ